MPNVPNPEFDFNGNSEPQRPLPPGVNPFDFDAYDKDPDSPVVNPAVSSPIPKPITVQPPKTDADAEKPIVAAPKAEKKPMSTASWYAVTGTALSATLGGAVGAGVGFLIAGPAGLIPGYTYGTIASEAVIVAVPEVLIAVESLSRALEKNGSDIGAVEWLEARRQEVNGIGSGIVTTIGELRDMIGNGLQFVRDGVGTIVQGRIDGFKENGTAAGVGIGVVAGVGGLLTGGTAVLPIVVGGVALKAADALLPEGYQPLNYLLRTGRDLVEAVDNGGQMMLEKEKDGEEPKLLPKRYEELSKAVELELKGRKISVDKDQLKALVDPIAAEIAKTLSEGQETEYARLRAFRGTVKNDLKGDNGLVTTEIKTQNERHEREIKEARAAQLERVGLGEGLKTAIMHQLDKGGIPGADLEKNADSIIRSLEQNMITSGRPPVAVIQEYMTSLQKWVDQQTGRTTTSSEVDVELVDPASLNRTEVMDAPGSGVKKAGAKMEVMTGKSLSNDAWVALLSAVTEGTKDKKFDASNKNVPYAIAQALVPVIEQSPKLQNPDSFEKLMKALKNVSIYMTKSAEDERNLPQKLAGKVREQASGVGRAADTERKRDGGSGMSRGGDARKQPDVRKKPDADATQAD